MITNLQFSSESGQCWAPAVGQTTSQARPAPPCSNAARTSTRSGLFNRLAGSRNRKLRKGLDWKEEGVAARDETVAGREESTTG